MADGISLLPEEFKKKEEEERKKRAKQKPDIALYVPGASGKAAPPSSAAPVRQPGFFARLFRAKPKPLIAKPTGKPVVVIQPAPVARPPGMSVAPPVSQPPKPVALPPAPPAPPMSPAPPPAIKAPVAPPTVKPKPKGPQFSTAADGGGVLRVSLIHEEGGKPVRSSGSGLKIVTAVIIASVVLVAAGALAARAMAASRSAEIAGVEAQVAQTDQRIAEADAALSDARRAGKQLAAIRKLLDAHVEWTNFFAYLESNTIPTVTFTQLRSESLGTVTLEALAETFPAAAEQLVVFRTSPAAIGAVDAGGLTADVAPNGQFRGVRFTVTLTLAPKLLTPAAAVPVTR